MTARSKTAGPVVPRRRGMPLLVLILGAASVLVLVGTDRLRQRAAAEDRALLRAVSQIEVDVAIVHLWIEEYVSEDLVDLEDVDRRLARIQAVAAGLHGLHGRGRDAGLPALTSPALRAQAEALDGWVGEFAAISRERRLGYEAGLAVGIGSPTDARFDGVFAEVFAQTQSLEEALSARLQTTERRARFLFWGIVAAWSVLVASAAVAMWIYERHRLDAETALLGSQGQLLQAQKLEAVGRLAGGLAHDLNNYLAAIRGHCELVRRKRPDGDPIANKMDRVIGVVERAAGLIERLQTFSREQPLERQIIDLAALVKSTTAMVRPSLSEDIRLDTAAPADLWPVAVDPAQLEQVLVNLLVNARDAMPTGGEVRMSLANRAADPALGGDAVELRVADDGGGIAAELREKIFEPFLTTKGGRGHNGLGLAIVYGVVTRHDGVVEVESEVGVGTVFRILLPRATGLPSTPAARLDRGPVEGDERILLVDDHEEFREATRALLSELGYRVTAVADGEAALAAWRSTGAANGIAADDAHELGGGFDLVLTDVVMSKMGGPELAAAIRRLDPDARIVFLTGHAEPTLHRYGVGAGERSIRKNAASGEALARRIRQLLVTDRR